MIQWKSNYTGSTDRKVSGSNPTTINNQVGKDRALTTETERHPQEISNRDLKIKEGYNKDSSN
ncbi:MAG: two-component system response regulator, partial [Rivularia sp. (in: cyanobacteria)]